MFQDLKPYPEFGINQLPAGWTRRRLGSLGLLFKGSGGSKEDNVESGTPVLRYGELYTRHSNVVSRAFSYVSHSDAGKYTSLEVGDIVFAGSGESADDIGKSAVSLLPPPAVVGGDTVILRPNANCADPVFLAHFLETPSSKREKTLRSTGTIIFHVSANDLKTLEVVLPPIEEQRAIVTYLAHAHERINKAITTKRRLIALLEEQQRVVASEAIRGTLTSSAPLIDSGIPYVGQVPADWQVDRLGWHIELLAGFPFESSGFITGADGVRLLRGANVGVGGVVWDDVVRWPAENASGVSAFALNEGDLVLGLDRPVIRGGVRVARVSARDIPSLLVQRVARLRARPTLDSEFLRLSLAGQGFTDYLAPIFTGISVPHLSPKQVRDFRLAIPPIEEQRRIVEQVAGARLQLENGAAVTRQEIRLLEEFRTRLTADVVTGQVDVRSIAATLPPIELADMLAASATADDADEDETADVAGMEDE